MKTIFTKEQIDFIKNNYNKMSYSEIAKILNFSERQIRGKVNNMNLSKSRKFNKNYFNNIDTPNKAYILGLLYADGWVVNNKIHRNYEIGISLQEQDYHILEFINNELGGVHKITTIKPREKVINGIKTKNGTMKTLRIFCKQIVEDLIKHNVCPNKTKLDKYPIVEKEYFFDFLRGYIDGDGCFYVNKNKKLSISITCSSEIPLEYIKQKLLFYNIHSSVYKEKDRKYRLFCSRKEDVNLLIHKLYYNSNICFLKRKYEKIKSYL